MELSLDPNNPVPLYHQIVESLRYRIATGDIAAGTRLPAVRQAATMWKVNLHTVRRAYGELNQAGLVEMRRPGGTTVVGRSIRRLKMQLHRDVHDFLASMRKRHGLSADQVREFMATMTSDGVRASAPVTFVECSGAQAADYAAQIESQWQVVATPRVLDAPGAPAPGPILATFFHYNTVRGRWPDRLEDLHFVAVHPDPLVAAAISPFRRSGRRVSVILGETDAVRAGNVLPDVRSMLDAASFRIVPEIVKRPEDLFERRRRNPVLLAPRLWAQLTRSLQESRYVIQLRYVVDAAAIGALASDLRWLRRAAPDACTASA